MEINKAGLASISYHSGLKDNFDQQSLSLARAHQNEVCDLQTTLDLPVDSNARKADKRGKQRHGKCCHVRYSSAVGAVLVPPREPHCPLMFFCCGPNWIIF